MATDIAAGGIDVDDLQFVINYEIPNISETYVHRIGRTGRAGANGTAFSFCDAEEKSDLKNIEKLIGKKIPQKRRTSLSTDKTINPEKEPKRQHQPRNTRSHTPKPLGSRRKNDWRKNPKGS